MRGPVYNEMINVVNDRLVTFENYKFDKNQIKLSFENYRFEDKIKYYRGYTNNKNQKKKEPR